MNEVDGGTLHTLQDLALAFLMQARARGGTQFYVELNTPDKLSRDFYNPELDLNPWIL